MQIIQADHFHGSDLEKIEAFYGISKEQIISFSDNVNPLGISSYLREQLGARLDVITSYPDRDYTALRESIAAYAGCEKEQILVGNGSTELISLAVRVLAPKRALLPEPTYSEYEREVTLAGGEMVRCEIEETNGFRIDPERLMQALQAEIDLLVLCNPNNPTSQALSRQELRQILQHCREKGIFVMVDETYVEFCEEGTTAVPLIGEFSNLLVLRGTSKFFAAPGLRLGYAMTGNESLRETMRAWQNPWTISALAELAGRLLFQDHAYMEQTRTLLAEERTRVCDILGTRADLKLYPPHANFVLLRLMREDITSADLFDFCIRRGLLIRDCASFAYLDSSYIRICFRTPEEDDRLLQTLLEKLDA